MAVRSATSPICMVALPARWFVRMTKSYNLERSPESSRAGETIAMVEQAAGFLAYLFITLEMLFMVTPFALYYYSVYSPLLAGPFSLPATAWLPAFFLPHLSTEIL